MRWHFILAFVFALPCFAFDVVETGNAKITKNLFFLLDTSGSMSTTKLSKAIDAIIATATQETDDLNVAVVTFGEEPARWAGKPHTEPDGSPPEGWASLPSKESTDALTQWLGERKSLGSTPVLPALAEAFGSKTPKNGALSVILVTDGQFDEPTQTVLENIARLEQERHAVIVCYGIDSQTCDVDRLRMIAIQAKKANLLGGYFVENTETTGPH